MLSQSSLWQRTGGWGMESEEEQEAAAAAEKQPSGRRRGRTQRSQLSQLQTGWGLQGEEDRGEEGPAAGAAGGGDGAMTRGQRAVTQELAGLDVADGGGGGEGGMGAEAAAAALGFGEDWEGLRRLQGLNRELCMPAFMAALKFLLDTVSIGLDGGGRYVWVGQM